MMWLIISQTMNPFYMQRDVNRLSVEIYDQNYKDCSECINQLIYAIKDALSDNFIHKFLKFKAKLSIPCLIILELRLLLYFPTHPESKPAIKMKIVY